MSQGDGERIIGGHCLSYERATPKWRFPREQIAFMPFFGVRLPFCCLLSPHKARETGADAVRLVTARFPSRSAAFTPGCLPTRLAMPVLLGSERGDPHGRGTLGRQCGKGPKRWSPRGLRFGKRRAQKEQRPVWGPQSQIPAPAQGAQEVAWQGALGMRTGTPLPAGLGSPGEKWFVALIRM